MVFTLSDTDGTSSRHVCVALRCGANPFPAMVEADLIPFAVLRVVQSAECSSQQQSVGELQGWTWTPGGAGGTWASVFERGVVMCFFCWTRGQVEAIMQSCQERRNVEGP